MFNRNKQNISKEKSYLCSYLQEAPEEPIEVKKVTVCFSLILMSLTLLINITPE